MTTMAYVWLAAVVGFSILEGVTAALLCVWFIGGSIAAFFAALLGAGIWTQIILFTVVSAALLAALRPLARKRLSVKTVPTNADRILGQTGLVTEAIDNLTARGTVKISGVEWSARSEEGSPIAVDTQVKILRIDGVKVYVEPIKVPAEI